MKGDPTLQTVAESLGMSRMTVSRALRNAPGVAPATRARVREMADRLGYRPDPLVSALMTRLRGVHPQRDRPVIAYLELTPAGSATRTYAFREQLRQGATRRATALGYQVELFDAAALGVTERALGRILFARGIRGVLVAPLDRDRPLTIDLEPYAAATLGSSVTFPALHLVQGDPVWSYRCARDELRRRGLNRYGLVLERIHDERSRRELSGAHLREALDDPDLVPLLLVDRIESRELVRWARRHRAEAVVGFSHDLGPWLEELGERRPFVANLNWQPDDGADGGVDQQMGRIGEAMAELVVEQLQSNHQGVPEVPKRVLLPGRWVTVREHRPRGVVLRLPSAGGTG